MRAWTSRFSSTWAAAKEEERTRARSHVSRTKRRRKGRGEGAIMPTNAAC